MAYLVAHRMADQVTSPYSTKGVAGRYVNRRRVKHCLAQAKLVIRNAMRLSVIQRNSPGINSQQFRSKAFHGPVSRSAARHNRSQDKHRFTPDSGL
ncbi:MAG: hypothetical protein ACKV0T_18200 [Planctomycetales bacterium]